MANMLPYEKIAKILRTDKDNVRLVMERLGAVTGKKGIMERIVEENEATIEGRLSVLGITGKPTAKQIYDALIKKAETDNAAVSKFLGNPSATSPDDWNKILQTTKDIVRPPKGFFMKKEKALEFLRNKPPQKVMHSLGYRNVEELIKNENFFEIFSSLRFIEGMEWLNTEFLPQYKTLTPGDFEEREIMTMALSKKWADMAQEFIKKKHHNITHLKELGVIYIIPISLNISAETLRNFALILHYFNEVSFYSGLFRKCLGDEKTCGMNLISLLRGDVPDTRLPADASKSRWMIVQRYLAKDDEHDWRLFEPHINPEALHWERAERMLVLISRELKGFPTDLSFWHDLNWVGDYYKTDSGLDVLVSFNLVDAAMDLVKQKEMTKYLYHHQESLWNKIFMEYFGEDAMIDALEKNILKGWIEI